MCVAHRVLYPVLSLSRVSLRSYGRAVGTVRCV